MNLNKRAAAPAMATGATVIALLLAGCGGNDDEMGGMPGMGSSASPSQSSPSTSASAATVAGPHNEADVTFAKSMIPHHRQAVEMAKLAATRAQNAEVKALASKIQEAQGPEIETMSGWLTTWGEEVPAEGAMGDMAGMEGMSMEQMAALEKASGAAFDRMFLEMMTEHHNGAIAMAKAEQQGGQNPTAKALAAKIAVDQAAEVKTMATLAASLK